MSANHPELADNEEPVVYPALTLRPGHGDEQPRPISPSLD